MFFPEVWDLIERYKDQCKKKGWKIFKNEDIIETAREYHYFIWTRRLYPTTFKKVIMNPYFPLREGTSYRMVNVSYIAWITHEPVDENVLEVLRGTPGISRRVTIYDASSLHEGNAVCQRTNETDSVVFQEFERFLNQEYGIRFKPVYKHLQDHSVKAVA